MANAYAPGSHAQYCGRLRHPACKTNLRRGAWCAVNLYIAERDPRTEARTKCLEHRFLGREPSCQPLNPIYPITELIQLRLSKAARNQGIARILDPALHLGDNHQVNAMSDNVHKAPSVLTLGVRRYV